jgi:hypothetical protein
VSSRLTICSLFVVVLKQDVGDGCRDDVGRYDAGKDNLFTVQIIYDVFDYFFKT